MCGNALAPKKKPNTRAVYVRMSVSDGVLCSIFTQKHTHLSTTHIEHDRGSCVFSHVYSHDEVSLTLISNYQKQYGAERLQQTILA